MTGTRFFSFIGSVSGDWTIRSLDAVTGDPISAAPCLDIRNVYEPELPGGAAWCFRGVTSHQRYTTRSEQDVLARKPPVMGRLQATCAALILIRKSADWWTLPQDVRRDVFEERSRHTSIGLDYLPAIARRLHHSRDLGEPFDFVTWFEFAPDDLPTFENLLCRLRATEEWTYVDREIDLRLTRNLTR